EAVCTRLEIDHPTIVSTQGESYMNLMETHFNIQRRLYDYQFSWSQNPGEALHKKSGQKSDSAVNKDFLASFWRLFNTKKSLFGRKKHRQGTLFVQSPLGSWHRPIKPSSRRTIR